jgi:hypothetical protein
MLRGHSSTKAGAIKGPQAHRRRGPGALRPSRSRAASPGPPGRREKPSEPPCEEISLHLRGTPSGLRPAVQGARDGKCPSDAAKLHETRRAPGKAPRPGRPGPGNAVRSQFSSGSAPGTLRPSPWNSPAHPMDLRRPSWSRPATVQRPSGSRTGRDRAIAAAA